MRKCQALLDNTPSFLELVAQAERGDPTGMHDFARDFCDQNGGRPKGMTYRYDPATFRLES